MCSVVLRELSRINDKGNSLRWVQYPIQFDMIPNTVIKPRVCCQVRYWLDTTYLRSAYVPGPLFPSLLHYPPLPLAMPPAAHALLVPGSSVQFHALHGRSPASFDSIDPGEALIGTCYSMYDTQDYLKLYSISILSHLIQGVYNLPQ